MITTPESIIASLLREEINGGRAIALIHELVDRGRENVRDRAALAVLPLFLERLVQIASREKTPAEIDAEAVRRSLSIADLYCDKRVSPTQPKGHSHAE